MLTFSSHRTEFLTTVSHEIRTPIASILGICELLLGDQISDEQRQLVQKAIQSGENLLELVGTVLVRFFLLFASVPYSSSPGVTLRSPRRCTDRRASYQDVRKPVNSSSNRLLSPSRISSTTPVSSRSLLSVRTCSSSRTSSRTTKVWCWRIG
jgi:hypothetical protein